MTRMNRCLIECYKKQVDSEARISHTSLTVRTVALTILYGLRVLTLITLVGYFAKN